METTIVSSESVLVIQLSRFSIPHSRLRKDQQLFNCSPEAELDVPIAVEDKISFSSKYSLLASIDHSGILDQGNYWTVIKDLNSGG